MTYNKEALLQLPAEEKQELAKALWNSIEDDNSKATEEEIQFAKDRLQLHLDKPADGISIEGLQKMVKDKYGF